jgi:hypothetical protein
MKPPMWSGALLVGVVLACSDHQGAARDSLATFDTGGVAPATDSQTRVDADLERAARQAVRFLRGEAVFDSLALADTVELRVAPEGGGAVSMVSRDALRDRSAWTVVGPQQRFPLVPPVSYSTLSTKVGRHFNCQEQDLSTRAPDLAKRPHVGVRLQPESPDSCLQSWNATFVFDMVSGSPRLTAILYDQWEW